MSEGIILSIFDENKGFVPVDYYPSDIRPNLTKEIIFRTTLNLMGGTKDLIKDRESFIDIPEHQLIGCSHMKSIESTMIRGGSLPIVIILFVSTEYRNYLYHSLIEIMEILNKLMKDLLPLLKESKFRTHKKIKNSLSQYYEVFRNNFSGFLHNSSEKKSKSFTILCPECSQEVDLVIPNEIPDFLTIPVAKAPCGHIFDAYFTKGPVFRGTSESKTTKKDESGLKDVFNNL